MCSGLMTDPYAGVEQMPQNLITHIWVSMESGKDATKPYYPHIGIYEAQRQEIYTRDVLHMIVIVYEILVNYFIKILSC